MHTWIIKARVQKFISHFPFSYRVNLFFQKYVTRGLQLTDQLLIDKLIHSKNHLDSYLNFGESPKPANILELGTGWFPVIPICMFITGAENIITIDVNPSLTKKRTADTIRKILEFIDSGRFADYIPGIVENRLIDLRNVFMHYRKITFEEILKSLKIELYVGDLGQLELKPGQNDLIISNNTLEHIRSEKLKGTMTELARTGKPGGIMSHFIDMSDHFAHIDGSINIFNFLQFSDRQWTRIDNSIQPQNRERIGFYRQILNDLNMEVAEERNRYGKSEWLEKIVPDKRFQDLPVEELLISHSHMIIKL